MICCINTCTHKCILTPPPPLTLHRILSLSVCQRSKCRLALQRLRVSAAAQFGFSLFTAGAKRRLFQLSLAGEHRLEGAHHRQSHEIHRAEKISVMLHPGTDTHSSLSPSCCWKWTGQTLVPDRVWRRKHKRRLCVSLTFKTGWTTEDIRHDKPDIYPKPDL